MDKVAEGVEPDDFRLDNTAARLRRRGDLWRPLVWPKRGRFDVPGLMKRRARHGGSTRG